MKLLVLYASPRKQGYSARFLDEAIRGYQEAHPNAEVHKVYLNDLNMKGCQHCSACKTDDPSFTMCILPDDLQPVLKLILECDAVLWGIPNYMADYNAQAKILIDRYYGYMKKDFSSRLPEKQKSGVIMVQGNPEVETYKDVEAFLVGFFGQRGRRPSFGLTIGGCRGADGSSAPAEELAKAFDLGKKLA